MMAKKRWERYGGDAPISRVQEDTLERLGTSEQIREICAGMESTQGMTIGLTGAWGTGKTSCLNMARELLETDGLKVVEFNPWLWQDSGSLTYTLLETVAYACEDRSRLNSVGREIEKYAGIVAGLDPRAQAAWKAWESYRGTGVGKSERLRKSIEGGMQKREKPLVVLVDDLDRLERKQAEEVLRAIRQVGGLPKVIYVVGLDKDTTAEIISSGRFDGNAYLEKVLTVEIPVPPLHQNQKRRLIEEQIRTVMEGNPEAAVKLDKEISQGSGFMWLMYDILLKLLETPRDIKRYGIRMEGTLEALGEAVLEVRMMDLLALEAVRMKLPKIGKILETRREDIAAHMGSWIVTEDTGQEREDTPAKETKEAMVEAAGAKGGGRRNVHQGIPPKGRVGDPPRKHGVGTEDRGMAQARTDRGVVGVGNRTGTGVDGRGEEGDADARGVQETGCTRRACATAGCDGG